MRRRMSFEGLEVRKLMTADMGFEADVSEAVNEGNALIIQESDLPEANSDAANGNDLDIQIRTRGRTGYSDVMRVAIKIGNAATATDDVWIDGNIITAENYDDSASAEHTGDEQSGDTSAVDSVFAADSDETTARYSDVKRVAIKIGSHPGTCLATDSFFASGSYNDLSVDTCDPLFRHIGS